ncbi:hypothetical protein [Chryseosolibacter indicus]|uniref:DUF4840 domain-containing protein n=1 Tax=Chryseosolibacter indicus TaxID=2782351 RepID=A0ABS5VNQ8_9BACT|nr:hypothetical protein [Chryseosolibacter indicus]MBT1703068.1 hypothetical protein [Chryseosolibacter indicus]
MLKRHFFSLLLIAITSIVISGCDLFDKVDDVTFDGEIVEEGVIEGSRSDKGVISYEENIDIEAAKNPEVARFSNKIKDFEIRKITFEITEFKSSALKVNTSGALFYIKSSSKVLLAEVKDFNITSAFMNAVSFTLPANESELKELSALLKADKKFNLLFTGTLSAPVTFKFKIVIDAKIVAETV